MKSTTTSTTWLCLFILVLATTGLVHAHEKLQFPSARYKPGQFTDTNGATGDYLVTDADRDQPTSSVIQDGCGNENDPISAKNRVRTAPQHELMEGKTYYFNITIGVNHAGSTRFGVEMYKTAIAPGQTAKLADLVEPAHEGYMGSGTVLTENGVVTSPPYLSYPITIRYGYACENCAIWSFYLTDAIPKWWHSCSDVVIKPATFNLQYTQSAATPVDLAKVLNNAADLTNLLFVSLGTPDKAGDYILSVDYWIDQPGPSATEPPTTSPYKTATAYPFHMEGPGQGFDLKPLANGPHTITAYIKFAGASQPQYIKTRLLKSTFTVKNLYNCEPPFWTAQCGGALPVALSVQTLCPEKPCKPEHCCAAAGTCGTVQTQCQMGYEVANTAKPCAVQQCTTDECCTVAQTGGGGGGDGGGGGGSDGGSDGSGTDSSDNGGNTGPNASATGPTGSTTVIVKEEGMTTIQWAAIICGIIAVLAIGAVAGYFMKKQKFDSTQVRFETEMRNREDNVRM